VTLPLTNGELVELLARAADASDLGYQRRRALRRAARAALSWPEEAGALHLEGRPLTELRYVGPWLAATIAGWLEAPPALTDPPVLRRGFRTAAESHRVLAAAADWPALRGDLQTHTLDSDGTTSVAAMAAAAAERGYEYLAITDHTQGLKIANGMDAVRLATQGEEIRRLNDAFAAEASPFRLLRAMEMNLSPAGEGDMDVAVRADLDLVLGAFHSKLRVREDQTERYVAALRQPAVHVLAHPRGRIFNFRAGLSADWSRVFDVAAAEDRAVEIDAFPDRQDLDVELLELARASGTRISIGSDAHAPWQLAFAPLGSAAALMAAIPRERIVNFMTRDQLLAWSRAVTERTVTAARPGRAVART
jgi:histidinol phosphatase-like PHP family hydrolase